MIDERFISLDESIWTRKPRQLVVGDVGGKALGLGSIKAADLPTPAAIIVPTEVYRAGFRKTLTSEALNLAADSTNFPLDNARRELESLDFDSEFVARLEKSVSYIPGPYAVRSSAVVEDAADSSWAGQFLTVLNVQINALPRSIVRCWASIFTPAVASYATVNNFDLRHIYMAVIIQKMIRPAWAGVLFTGVDIKRQRSTDSVLFEAVRGLGEKLVNGAVRPELRAELRLTDFSVHSRSEDANIGFRHRYPNNDTAYIPAQVLATFAKGASRLRQIHNQEFLDIEWAWDGTTTWFLQVRNLVST